MEKKDVLLENSKATAEASNMQDVANLVGLMSRNKLSKLFPDRRSPTANTGQIPGDVWPDP